MMLIICDLVMLQNPVQAPSQLLTFRAQNDAAKCKIYASAGKIVIYNFWSITRNITRSVIIVISH